MFKELLNTAKNKFDAHQREEEIRYLDIDPEEYVMLRDDKNSIAFELLEAILEKLKIPNWEVDSATLRIVRISEASSGRKTWSLAITSDTRRFHLKVYRDFEPDLVDIDLASSRGICTAITFIEKKILDIREQKIREEERKRLAALEEERRHKQEELAEILGKVQQVNDQLMSIYNKKLSSAKLGEEFLARATEYISQKVSQLKQEEVALTIEGDIYEIKERFQGSLFKIIDEVPCQLDERSSLIKVSNSFINYCVCGKNLVQPACEILEYIQDTRSLVLRYECKNKDELQDQYSYEKYNNQMISHIEPKTLSHSSNPLTDVETIFKRIHGQNLITKSDVANISLFDIDTKVANFNDMIKFIDNMLARFAQNVNLIAWNQKNSSN